MSKDNGGSIFPTVEANYHNENMRGDGISLRDYFAAKAMEGIISGILSDGSKVDINADPNVALAAYKISDAMLAERAK